MSHAIRFLNPKGPEALKFHSLLLTERMGEVSEGRLVALSSDRNISIDELLGQKVCVEIETQHWGKRYHSAYVTRFEVGARHEADTLYHVELRPWLWFLARTADSRIFQNQSVVQILQTVFADCPVAMVSNRLTKTYATRPYTVQYRESDWNFVSRLMEREGIYYFFEHTASEHILVLADSASAHPKLDGDYAKIPYSDGANALGMSVDEESFSVWRSGKSIQSGQYVINDYDFKRPSADLKMRSAQIRTHPHADAELYDYPGEYRDKFTLGDDYVRIRMQEQACQHERMFGSGGVRGCTPGGVFKLQHHPRDEQNQNYLIIATTTRLEESGYESSGGQFHASVEIEAQPFSVPYAPQRITPKPFVQGTQTALVVGPAGEEIYCDEYGRIKVQFYWDRYGTKNDQSSCWVRVSHPWAGSGFGGMHLPRIGQEVVVSFMEGDPDYPVVTGRMYNAENPPPWALPANKTQSGFLTRSSQGGSAANANALRFEDKMGQEEVWLHAEKDQRIEVEHDESHWVGHDRVKNIDHDETTHVKHDRTETVDNNETITIHGMRTETVDKNETITVHQNRTERVDKSEIVDVGDNRTMTVGKNEKLEVGKNKQDKIGKNWSMKVGKFKTETIGLAYMQNVGLGKMVTIGAAYMLNVGGMMMTNVGMSRSVTVGGSQTTSVGSDQTTTIGSNYVGTVTSNYTENVGENFTLSSGTKNTITAGKGGSSIVMTPDSVLIKVGDATISLNKSGEILISGTKVTTAGTSDVSHISPNINNN